MRLLVCQLSDIHITGLDDAILTRGKAIASAIRTVADGVDLCIIAVSGDIAFSGEEPQYVAATSFFKEICGKLGELLATPDKGTPIHLVVVPGNHDCDFSTSVGARDIVLKAIARQPDQMTDESVVELCTKPQESFFAFADEFASHGREPQDNAFARLSYSYVFSHGAESARFVCCNTAWLSRRGEIPGTLSFPPTCLPERRSDDAITLAVFHHPYNWIDPDVARAFKKHIESVVDVVLTGHEHSPDDASVTRRSGSNNTYLEGGVLQESADANVSSFNVLVVDTVEDKKHTVTFEWTSDRYQRASEDDDEPWEAFSPNRLRVRPAFTLNSKTNAWIDDPGINIQHPRTRQVRLSDIFVFPDLRESVIRPGSNLEPRLVRGEQVADAVCSLDGELLILGDHESGKTCLAKSLMREFLDRGDVPVYVSGGDLTLKSLDQLRKLFEDKYAAQYDRADRVAYGQLPASRRVVIVDDYHKLTIIKARKTKLLSRIGEFAGRVILIAHDMLTGVDAFAETDPSVGSRNLRIQPFSHTRRSDLTEKWLLLGDNVDSDALAFAQLLQKITRTLDTIIGKNFVPAYPPYLLAVLQATQAATPIDTKASTHGYFYELFIKMALAKGRTSVQYDMLVAYLAALAYRFYQGGGAIGLSEPTLRQWHAAHVGHHDIEISFEQATQQLLDQKILERRDDEFVFVYPYMYYYFVATSLASRMHDVEVRAQLATLTESLHLDESANILLFLVHLSRDPSVIDGVLRVARRLYEGVEPARMDDDVAFLADLESAASEITVFEDKGHREARSEQLQALDDEVDHTSGPPSARTSAIDPQDPITRIGMALRTLQILGQIVKNFAGSLDGKTKVAIVDECYQLGLRVLGWTYTTVRENQVAHLQTYADVIQRHHPKYPREKLIEKASKAVSGVALLCSLGIIKRISSAVGSADLEPTYRKVSLDSIPAHRLIHLSIQLDQNSAFPMSQVRALARETKDRPMAMLVLRAITTQHLRFFPVPPTTKQTACAILGMKYEQVTPFQPKLLKRS